MKPRAVLFTLAVLLASPASAEQGQCALTPIAPERIRVSAALESRREEFARAASIAERNLCQFALKHGISFQRPSTSPLIEVVDSQAVLLERVRGGARRETLVALSGWPVTTVPPEEYVRVLPEMRAVPDAWSQLLAHEMAHGIWPPGREWTDWLIEGFASVAAGQRFAGAPG